MARPNTTQPRAQVTLARDGQSKGGTPIYGKAGPVKAPLYLDSAWMIEQGLDPAKPVILTITQ